MSAATTSTLTNEADDVIDDRRRMMPRSYKARSSTLFDVR
jgi:hypothetical protein